MTRTIVMRLAIALATALALTGTAAAEPRIEWRLENPFRFFGKPADTEMHRATFEALSENERIASPVLSAERALARRHGGDGWAAGVLDAACWEPQRNRHTCAGQGDYMNPRSHRIIATLKDVEDATRVDCTWLTAPKGGRRRGAAVTFPCDTPVILEIPYPSGARVSVEVGGVEVAGTPVAIKDVLILGLGDSFGSGEGNPDVPVRFSRDRVVDYPGGKSAATLTGYPARVGDWSQIGDAGFIKANPRWLDQACHRSIYSHQLRAALQLAVENPHRAVTFMSFACSGAETVNGLFLRYKGHEWVPNPPDLSQLSAAARAQCGERNVNAYDLPEAYHMKGHIPELQGGLVLVRCDLEEARKIDLVLLSVGGNDVGFSRLVANAILADKSVLRRLGGWFGEVHGFKEAADLIDALEFRYKSLNRAMHNILHVPWGESDRVLLVGYPSLTLLDDGRSICPDGRAGMTVVPDFELKAAQARDSMVAGERLNDMMRSSSRQLGWTFVERHRPLFVGRSICSTNHEEWATRADDLRLPRRIDGRWVPFNPADWQPYVQRQRWFRTPNDAFMTANFHVARSFMQKAIPKSTLSWFQVLLASLYSGAFHPTAEGQAAIADAVVVEARRVLARYATH
ncbi:MAG: hypothetical protein R3D68_03135 [Hyphomicrobiaceae bacterium]